MRHPSGIDDAIVRKVVARRGTLHAYESVIPSRTALVVIDLDEASVNRDENCARMVPAINKLATCVRESGGIVAWVTSLVETSGRCFDNLRSIVGQKTADRFARESVGPGTSLWHDLRVGHGDLRAVKTGASAFFPGKCDLPDRLFELRIDTVLIAGTVTNICCESSGRDANELGFRVIMISDCLAGHSRGLHEASLATFYRIFGDVRPSTEVAELLIRPRDE